MKNYRAVGKTFIVKITREAVDVMNKPAEETDDNGLYTSKMKDKKTEVDTKWEGVVLSKGSEASVDIDKGDLVKLFPLMNGATALVDSGTDGLEDYKIYSVGLGDILAVITED
jgi:hypothetical protein